MSTTQAGRLSGAAGQAGAGQSEPDLSMEVLLAELNELRGDLILNETLTLLERAARTTRELVAQRRAFEQQARSPRVLIAQPGQDPRNAVDPRVAAARNVEMITKMLNAEIGAIMANADRLRMLLSGPPPQDGAEEPERRPAPHAALRPAPPGRGGRTGRRAF